MNTVVFSDNIPNAMIRALYGYYENAKHSMTIGELYLLLKLLVSCLEEEIEKMGMDINMLENPQN